MDEVRANVDRPFQFEPERHMTADACSQIRIGVIDFSERRRTIVAAGALYRGTLRLRSLHRADLDLQGSRVRYVLAQVGATALDG